VSFADPERVGRIERPVAATAEDLHVIERREKEVLRSVEVDD
jgi:hypothetical protein